MIAGRTLRWALIVVVLTTARRAAAQDGVFVHGVVRDSVSHAPIRLASVRVAGAAQSALTDDAGQFRVAVARGPVRLDVRRIGFRPATVQLAATDSMPDVEVSLAAIAYGLATVVVTADDEEAKRIIRAAIARKQSERGQLHDYRYDAHTRFVVGSADQPISPKSPGAMGESVTTAYWEAPDHFQERILARRQTANVDAQRNLVRAGQIEDFSRDRIPLFGNLLASPIADDALDHYRYHVLDTLATDGRRVFRLSVDPSSDREPAFVGVIDIVDSTFDVAAFDVGVNSATNVGAIRDFRFHQQFGDAGGGRWMPSTIGYTATVKLTLPFVHDPPEWVLLYSVGLDDFRFNQGSPPAGLGEYVVIVDDRADHADSAVWAGAPPLPPPATAMEQLSIQQVDSIASSSRSARQLALQDFARRAITVGSSLDLFHFDRVDGWYFGAGWTWRGLEWAPWMVPTVKLGYATGAKQWEYRAGDQFLLSEDHRLWVGALFHDETITRPGFASPTYNPSLRAVLDGPAADAQDYYREWGLVGSLTAKLVKLTTLDLAYTDVDESSLALLPRYATSTNGRAVPVANPPILDGRLRSVSAAINYDSRPMVHERGQDLRLPTQTGTRLSFSAEASDPSVLGGDFDYRRYTARFERRQNTFGVGLTTFTVVGGLGTSSLPPQRYFTIDGGAQVLESQDAPFSTVRDSTFTGNRAAAVFVEHSFGRLLFTRSGIPGVRDLPFTISAHAGAFWSDFTGTSNFVADTVLSTTRNTTRGPYREVGFTVGNLTPFLGPIDLALRFGWQLSSYPTSRLRIGIGFGR